jgi:hypothetical protein
MRVALRHRDRRVTEETADQEERHPSRGEDRRVAVPEVVPLDAPEPGALLRRPEHLLELPRPQQRAVVVAEDQLCAVTGPESRRLGCQVHPALSVALRRLDRGEAGVMTNLSQTIIDEFVAELRFLSWFVMQP